MTTEVVVSFSFEGFHNWPQAPLEHAYLRDRHRHMFHVKATKPVSHDDRETEIIELKRLMSDYVWYAYGLELENKSCEMVAKELLQKFNCSSVEVLEDGENGAIVHA